MTKSIALGLVMAAALAAPAMAAPICSGSFALDRARYSEAQINDYTEQVLRGMGLDVTRTEIWSGCIRAYVRMGDGSEQMQFFEPLNYRRVE